MRDLQEYFESLSDEEYKKWDDIFEETEFERELFDKIYNTIEQVYKAEMDMPLPDDAEFIETLFTRLKLYYLIHTNIKNGYVKMKEGKRMELKDEYKKENYIVTETGSERARKIKNKEI